MSAPSQDTAVRTGIFMRAAIYVLLILFAVYFLLPLYVMLVNSLKPLSEIQQGRMLALPLEWTLAPWGSAWSTAQIMMMAEEAPMPISLRVKVKFCMNSAGVQVAVPGPPDVIATTRS